MELDDVLHELKDWGKYQTLAFILITVSGTWFPAWQIFSGAFTLATPEYYHCNPAPNTFPNQSLVLQNETDDGAVRFGVESYENCLMYDVKEGEMITDQTKIVGCQNGWEYYTIYPEESTAVIEMNLVCDRDIWPSTAQSVYFAGVMVGAFGAGQLSDIYGRKTVLIVSFIGEGICGLVVAFLYNYYAFVSVWFLVGMFENGINIVEYVLVVEMFTPKKRTLAACINNISWGLGVTLLAPIAWLLKDWRWMQIAISIPCFLAIFYYWLIHESVRWLLSRGRTSDAQKVVEKIAEFNNLGHVPVLTNSDDDFAMKKETYKKKSTEGMSNGESEKGEADMAVNHVRKSTSTSSLTTVFGLFRKKRLFLNSVNMFCQWLMCSLVYYGLSLNSSELAGDKYLNFFLLGLVEIPAYTLIMYTLVKWGRRPTLVVSNFVAAVACIITAYVPETSADGTNLQPVIVSFAMIGKLGITCSFGTVFVYGTEIFPTSIRNVGFGLCSFWSRVGGVMAPFVIYLNRIYEPGPLLIFGISSFFCGGIALFLPETLDRPLPETLEEGNNLHKTKPIHSSRAESPYIAGERNLAMET
ncbi:organic cation transporter protein-like [Strongylocentrotus purpuratus]|uniref:Major facilitator superfamily (MFS) profile domain-containing protein n=1 Tax=Strongylocentrotus purpuratus TaxID=7668 RepID=A0A7M7NK37_STRPU|nr:organic cation transporter protein-like [Strongylocentrotus purpuratus]